MKFYKLNSEQKKLWADKLMDLANFTVASLVFGQALSTERLNTVAMGLGVAGYTILAVTATYLGGD